jgi:hypothetical protein
MKKEIDFKHQQRMSKLKGTRWFPPQRFGACPTANPKAGVFIYKT